MINIDPEKIYAKLLKVGEEWADANSAACLLEETKKTVLHDEANAAIKNGETTSAARAEQLAYASPKYISHVNQMVEARRLANQKRAAYDICRS